jgi:hypothetical protein
LIWLGIYVLSPGFSFQYVVWGLPFFLMAGYLWEVAALQVALVPPAALYYLRLQVPHNVVLYVAIMLSIWISLGLFLVRIALSARGAIDMRLGLRQPAR